MRLGFLVETELGWLKVRMGVAGMSEARGLFWLDIDAVRTGVGKLLEEHVGIGEANIMKTSSDSLRG